MDAMSSAGYSSVSDTDRMLFTVLSNPDRVDISGIPSHSREEPRIVEMANVENLEYMPRISESPPPPQDCANDMDVPSEPKEVVEDHTECQGNPSPGESAQGEREPRIDDDELEKRSILLDLQQLAVLHGITLTKEWTMEDPLEDMMLEIRRHTLALDEKSNVTMMRDGLKLLITGIELVNSRMGLLDLDGWSSEVCKDLQKHDANLSRIYRKYWKRSTSSSPEMEIARSIAGSMGFHHLKRTMSKHMMGRATKPSAFSRRRPPSPASSEEEAPQGMR